MAGVDVRGETIPAVPGKPVTLSLLEGVESDDGETVIAGGSALVRGRIHRGDHGRVSANGDVACRHTAGGDILAGGTLRIANDAIGGVLRARAIEVGRRATGTCVQAETWVSISEAGSPAGAASRMSELHIQCLIVSPNDARKSIGIITCKDIVQLLGDEPPDVLDEIRVKDAMTSPAITLQEHMSVTDCILLMRMSGVRSVPVLRAQELIGLLSFTDILDAVAAP